MNAQVPITVDDLIIHTKDDLKWRREHWSNTRTRNQLMWAKYVGVAHQLGVLVSEGRPLICGDPIVGVYVGGSLEVHWTTKQVVHHRPFRGDWTAWCRLVRALGEAVWRSPTDDTNAIVGLWFCLHATLHTTDKFMHYYGNTLVTRAELLEAVRDGGPRKYPELNSSAESVAYTGSRLDSLPYRARFEYIHYTLTLLNKLGAVELGLSAQYPPGWHKLRAQAYRKHMRRIVTETAGTMEAGLRPRPADLLG